MLWRTKQCPVCSLYRCNPGCENEHEQEEQVEVQDDIVRTRRDHSNEKSNGVIFQPCGGGHRVIKKKIGND